MNDPEEIQKAFLKYDHDAPQVTEHPDPRQLYNLRSEIFARHIMYEAEVE